MRKLYGDAIFNDSHKALQAIGEAVEAYQQTPAEFSAYTSKYDFVLRGQVKLSDQEARGKVLFDSKEQGNCASCHPDTMEGGFPAFTDFGFNALGVPRNRAIPANADPKYYDLGLCGPYRTDLAKRGEFCGMFRTPSLRNVATRKRFFHNGGFTSLTKAVAFYSTRDTNPERWYPRGEVHSSMPSARSDPRSMTLPFCLYRWRRRRSWSRAPLSMARRLGSAVSESVSAIF